MSQGAPVPTPSCATRPEEAQLRTMRMSGRARCRPYVHAQGSATPHALLRPFLATHAHLSVGGGLGGAAVLAQCASVHLRGVRQCGTQRPTACAVARAGARTGTAAATRYDPSVQNFDADAEVAGNTINLLKPIGVEVVTATDGAFGEIVGEGATANGAHGQEKTEHRVMLQAVSFQLQRPLQGTLFNHCCVHALPLTVTRVLDCLSGVRQDHQAEVRKATRCKGGGDERAPHRSLQLCTHAIDAPLCTGALVTQDVDGAEEDAGRHFGQRHRRKQIHLRARLQELPWGRMLLRCRAGCTWGETWRRRQPASLLRGLGRDLRVLRRCTTLIRTTTPRQRRRHGQRQAWRQQPRH
mmetsp:Transcript_18211/g.50716  ORF Transcript_18211/g.50716 Transcript_18211/m.50716 type:complete len:354 (-) Transcript_18211:636-1697(-)